MTANKHTPDWNVVGPDLYAAVAAVIDATRAHLPPDGITKEEFISRVIVATDNTRMAEIME